MAREINKKAKVQKRFVSRQRNTAKYVMQKDAEIDYKDITLLQKYLNDRGKMLPRRITGVSAGNQRKLSLAIKRARFLGLLVSGSSKKI